MAKETFRQQAIRINDMLNTPKYRLTKRDEDLARAAVMPPQLIIRSYYCRKIHYCSECGSHVTTSLKQCPCCGAKFKEEPQEEYNWVASYHCILQRVENLQVLRFVLVKRYTKFNKQASFYVDECMRHIYNEQGERYIFHRNVQGLSPYYDAWCWGTPIVLKQEDKGRGWYCKAAQRQNLDVHRYRIKSLTEQWKHKPIKDLLRGDSYKLRVMATPWGEFMFKCYRSMFDYCVDHWRTLSKDEFAALKIAHRHHYEIKDISMWLDHISQVAYLHLDCHNPFYVCPKDLRAAHQVMTERFKREQARRAAELKAKALERKLKRMAKEDEAYQKRWGNVLDIFLSGKNLSIRPLQSITEFAEEGSAMHHCVFANEYYNRPHTLILTAKDDKGGRLATIEYDCTEMKIMQCRAACNDVPERDAEIRELITSHKEDFKRLLKAA